MKAITKVHHRLPNSSASIRWSRTTPIDWMATRVARAAVKSNPTARHSVNVSRRCPGANRPIWFPISQPGVRSAVRAWNRLTKSSWKKYEREAKCHTTAPWARTTRARSIPSRERSRAVTGTASVSDRAARSSADSATAARITIEISAAWRKRVMPQPSALTIVTRTTGASSTRSGARRRPSRHRAGDGQPAAAASRRRARSSTSCDRRPSLIPTVLARAGRRPRSAGPAPPSPRSPARRGRPHSRFPCGAAGPPPPPRSPTRGADAAEVPQADVAPVVDAVAVGARDDAAAVVRADHRPVEPGAVARRPRADRQGDAEAGQRGARRDERGRACPGARRREGRAAEGAGSPSERVSDATPIATPSASAHQPLGRRAPGRRPASPRRRTGRTATP